MHPEPYRTKYEVWKQVFLAALDIASINRGIPDLIKDAASIANAAVKVIEAKYTAALKEYEDQPKPQSVVNKFSDFSNSGTQRIG